MSTQAKVRIVSNSMIYVGADFVGTISGRGEVYVMFKDEQGADKFAARFKYANPKASAVHWVKFILSQMTAKEYLAKLGGPERETPLGIAEKLGFVSYNVLKIQKMQQTKGK